MDKNFLVPIKAFGWLFVISGTVFALSFVLLVGMSVMSAGFPRGLIITDVFGDSVIHRYAVINFYAHFIIAVLLIIVGKGLLKLKQWSRQWAIWLGMGGIITSISANLAELSVVGYIPQITISLLIIYFFTRPKVKERFK